MLSFLAGLAPLADRTLRAGRSRFAGKSVLAGLTSRTIDAVFEFGQACVDTLGDVGAKLGYLGTQRRDDALRLCFDQCAFTLPCSTLSVEHLGQRLAPDVKKKGVVARFWRRY